MKRSRPAIVLLCIYTCKKNSLKKRYCCIQYQPIRKPPCQTDLCFCYQLIHLLASSAALKSGCCSIDLLTKLLLLLRPNSNPGENAAVSHIGVRSQCIINANKDTTATATLLLNHERDMRASSPRRRKCNLWQQNFVDRSHRDPKALRLNGRPSFTQIFHSGEHTVQ